MFDLPPTTRYRLARAPLAQALAQVRFPLQARLGTLEGIADLQERLKDRYPYLTQQQGQSIELQFGPQGPQAAVGSSGVQFTFSSDDGHSVVLAPDSATLTVGDQYVGVEDFGDRFHALLQVLQAAGTPRCDRLGVRYLTVAATPPGDEAAWTRWFRPELIGWVGTNVVDSSVSITAAITQIAFTSRPVGELAVFPADVQAFVRHGFTPAGSAVPGIPPVAVAQPSYLIDLDVFCLAPQGWNIDAITSQFRALHGQIDRFFWWSLTEDGKSDFGFEETP